MIQDITKANKIFEELLARLGASYNRRENTFSGSTYIDHAQISMVAEVQEFHGKKQGQFYITIGYGRTRQKFIEKKTGFNYDEIAEAIRAYTERKIAQDNYDSQIRSCESKAEEFITKAKRPDGFLIDLKPTTTRTDTNRMRPAVEVKLTVKASRLQEFLDLLEKNEGLLL